ncbi:MAG: DUF4388 domain-containing protein [Acidobacteriota bacterium]
MAIGGSLSDVAVADILQFIHLGHRSGTLVLQRDLDEVRLGFCDGKMVSARAAEMPNLGELLRRQGRLTPELMHRLADEQLTLPQRIPFGHLLLREGVLDREGLRELLQQQFELAVTRVRAWDTGNFEFLLEDPRVDDDIAVVWGPGDVGINPEVLLLEAARIFDERDARRDRETDEVVEPLPTDASAVLARLRRAYAELRTGMVSETASLMLMHLISESFERAVLFIVGRDALVSLGAFGDDSGGQPLAVRTRGLRLHLEPDHLLTRSVRAGLLSRSSFDEALLPEPLAGMLGQPRNGQAVAFPVVGTERVIGVIYADSGDRLAPPHDVEVLDLAAAQVGLILENELLRRQIRVPSK